MSDASSTAKPQERSTNSRHQRSVKNYLLDSHFQLKYAGILVGIALLLSIGLGVILWNTGAKLIEQGQMTVRQGQETVKRGQEVIVQSRKVSQVVTMNITEEYKNDPELAKIFSDADRQEEEKRLAEQKRLEQDAANLQLRAKDLEQQQRTWLAILIVILSVLVISVGIAGIIVTHRVAGPIFKMKRLLRQVGEGQLVVREKLRKGDELQHFFETFEKMVEALRARQQTEIAELDQILQTLRASRNQVPAEVDESITRLEKLRDDMDAQLQA